MGAGKVNVPLQAKSQMQDELLQIQMKMNVYYVHAHLHVFIVGIFCILAFCNKDKIRKLVQMVDLLRMNSLSSPSLLPCCRKSTPEK